MCKARQDQLPLTAHVQALRFRQIAKYLRQVLKMQLLKFHFYLLGKPEAQTFLPIIR